MVEAVQRGVGRPRSLSDERVAEAVVACGFLDLRAPAVAARLGVNPATLYRHAAGHEQLVDIAVTHLVNTTTWPSMDDGWRDFLERTTWALWDLVRAHPGLASASPTVGMTNDALMRLFNRVCLDLIAAGFSPADAGLAADLVIDLAIDSLRMREVLAAHAPETPAIDAWYEHFDGGLRAVMRDAMHGDPSAWFARKLSVALDGIEHVLAAGITPAD